MSNQEPSKQYWEAAARRKATIEFFSKPNADGSRSAVLFSNGSTTRDEAIAEMRKQTEITVSDAAVDRAALALFLRFKNVPYVAGATVENEPQLVYWHEATEKTKDSYRAEVRLVLHVVGLQQRAESEGA